LVDLCRIVRGRFGVIYSETGMGRLMHALDLSWQTPRPRHAETDRAAQEAFNQKKGFAAALARIAADHPEAERIEVWFQDGWTHCVQRVGQKGRMVRRWFQRGMRPRMVKDQRYRSAYIFGAVCPARDTGAALVVVAKDVVPGDAADWGFSSESGVRSRAVVAVEPGGHGERPLG
jgi:hypothetical protein